MHFMPISPCIVNQFLKLFQKDDTFLYSIFIPCKQPYMFQPKHVGLFAGNKNTVQKSVVLLEQF
jgi:hypothetical protein